MNFYLILNNYAIFCQKISVLESEEKQRIERLELLDELEEWRLLLQHYFLLYCLKITTLEGKKKSTERLSINTTSLVVENEANDIWNSLRFVSKHSDDKDYLS